MNKANILDTEAPFLDLHLSVENGFVSSKIYDKRDDFDFDIVNFPFLDGDVPCRASYGVYISQLIRFARVCNHVTDFNARNKCLTQGRRRLSKSGPAMKHKKRITSVRGTRSYKLGESMRGGIPPLVRWVWGEILSFQTSVETILIHFGAIFAIEALLILKVSFIHYDEAMSWSKTTKHECSYSQDLHWEGTLRDFERRRLRRNRQYIHNGIITCTF